MCLSVLSMLYLSLRARPCRIAQIKLILADPVEEIELRSYSAQRWTLRLTPTLRGSLATLDHLGSLPPCYTRKLAAPTLDPKEKHIRWLSFQIFQIFQTSNSQPSTGEIPTAPLEIKHLEIELWIWSILCAASSGTAHAFWPFYCSTWSHMKRPGNSGQLQSSVVMGLKGLTSVQFTSLMFFFSFFCR